MDRASLVRRRQQIREKENVATDTNSLLDSARAAVVTKKNTVKRKGPTRSTTSEDSQSETLSLKGRSERGLRESTGEAALAPAPPPVREKRAIRNSKQSKLSKAVYSTETNAGLVSRQLLQHSQFGEVKEYLQSTTKAELFEQAVVVAAYVQEVRRQGYLLYSSSFGTLNNFGCFNCI